jgi:hypothetical protein
MSERWQRWFAGLGVGAGLGALGALGGGGGSILVAGAVSWPVVGIAAAIGAIAGAALYFQKVPPPPLEDFGSK